LDKARKEELVDWRPAAVCHFPFGTFHGLRGLANRWSIKHIDCRCRSHGLRCLTILYSITSGSIDPLKKITRELIIASGGGLVGRSMVMGINTAKIPYNESVSHDKLTLLFMAGTQEASRSMLHHVLSERGLADVVTVGPYLEKAGLRIIVAVPLLKDGKLRNELKHHFMRNCPNLDLDLRGEVEMPEIFSEADIYIFPYRVDLKQFIPTSILEAMAAGIPVVLSDSPMLSSLSNDGKTAYQFRKGDAKHFWEVIRSAIADERGRREMVWRARKFVQSEWSIERSVEDIFELLAVSDSKNSHKIDQIKVTRSSP